MAARARSLPNMAVPSVRSMAMIPAIPARDTTTVFHSLRMSFKFMRDPTFTRIRPMPKVGIIPFSPDRSIRSAGSSCRVPPRISSRIIATRMDEMTPLVFAAT